MHKQNRTEADTKNRLLKFSFKNVIYLEIFCFSGDNAFSMYPSTLSHNADIMER